MVKCHIKDENHLKTLTMSNVCYKECAEFKHFHQKDSQLT